MPRTGGSARVVARLRVMRGEVIALGPGKVDLLRAIAGTGSIGSAAEEMDMSYMRAWLLIRTMNSAFRKPLVAKSRGGRERGGAALTDLGQKVLDFYDEMENAAQKAIQPAWNRLRRSLK